MSVRKAEQSLISAIIRTGDLGSVQDAGIDESWFREYPRQFRFIETRYRLKRTTPSLAVFKDRYPSFVMLRIDDVEYAIGNMKRYHSQQSLMGMMNDMTEALENEGDLSDTIGEMYRGLVTLQGQLMGTERETEIVQQWRSVYGEIVKRKKRVDNGKQIGLPTGWPTIDDAIGGWRPAHTIVLGARLNVGKTWGGVRTAVETVAAGGTVRLHTLEQNRADMAMRVAPFMARKFGKSGLAASELSRGKGDLKSVRTFFADTAQGTTGKLIIDDTPRGKLTTMALASKLERDPVDLLIIDYIQLMSNTPGDWTALAALSADITQLASDFQIPILCLSQLNRSNGTQDDADASGISGSDNIGMDADFVFYLQDYSTKSRTMRVIKNRHGEKGQKTYIDFDVNVGRMEEIGKQRADDIKDADRKDS